MGTRAETSRKERAILKFIEEQVINNGYPPSVREIGKAVDLKSTATVHGYIASLEQKGYIKKESQKGTAASAVPAACLLSDPYDLYAVRGGPACT